MQVIILGSCKAEWQPNWALIHSNLHQVLVIFSWFDASNDSLSKAFFARDSLPSIRIVKLLDDQTKLYAEQRKLACLKCSILLEKYCISGLGHHAAQVLSKFLNERISFSIVVDEISRSP